MFLVIGSWISFIYFIQNILTLAAKLVHHARRYRLRFGKHSPNCRRVVLCPADIPGWIAFKACKEQDYFL